MKVSIIIPIYNVEPYIKDCLHSVINQTYQNIEIILVDDCGTDKSMKIATEFTNQYTDKFKIIIVHHSKNSGLSAARNTGILNATGEYIYFLDSDDTLPNNAIEKLISMAFIHKELDFVIGGVKTYGDKVYTYPLHSKPYINNNTEIMNDYFLFKWNVMAWNKLIRKEFLVRNNIRFLEGFYHEDIDFSFKLAIHAKRMACCYDITYNYLIRKASITTNKKCKNFTDHITILKNNFNQLRNINHNEIFFNSSRSQYTIESLYRIYVEIIICKSNNISLQDKMHLLNLIKSIKKQFNYFLDNTPSTKLRSFIIETPAIISYVILSLYLKLKNKY